MGVGGVARKLWVSSLGEFCAERRTKEEGMTQRPKPQNINHKKGSMDFQAVGFGCINISNDR